MDTAKLNSWVQITTGLAIVVGLALVVWELKLNRDATMSQLSSDGYQMMSQMNTALLGENPSNVLAKACYEPGELTKSELVLLDNYYFEVLNRITRMHTIGRRGGFYTDEYWKSRMGQLHLLFQSHAGRGYWKEVATYLPPEVKSAGDELLANWNRPTCEQEHELWMKGIAESIETHSRTR